MTSSEGKTMAENKLAAGGYATPKVIAIGAK